MEKGVVYSVVNIPAWKKVTLKDILEQRYGVPVHVNNDANAFAVGESPLYTGRPVNRQNNVQPRL